MATKWFGLLNDNGSCTKNKERRDLIKCWYIYIYIYIGDKSINAASKIYILQYTDNEYMVYIAVTDILLTL